MASKKSPKSRVKKVQSPICIVCCKVIGGSETYRPANRWKRMHVHCPTERVKIQTSYDVPCHACKGTIKQGTDAMVVTQWSLGSHERYVEHIKCPAKEKPDHDGVVASYMCYQGEGPEHNEKSGHFYRERLLENTTCVKCGGLIRAGSELLWTGVGGYCHVEGCPQIKPLPKNNAKVRVEQDYLCPACEDVIYKGTMAFWSAPVLKIDGEMSPGYMFHCSCPKTMNPEEMVEPKHKDTVEPETLQDAIRAAFEKTVLEATKAMWDKLEKTPLTKEEEAILRRILDFGKDAPQVAQLVSDVTKNPFYEGRVTEVVSAFKPIPYALASYSSQELLVIMFVRNSWYTADGKKACMEQLKFYERPTPEEVKEFIEDMPMEVIKKFI